MQSRKVYVRVVAEFDPSGNIIPVSIVWEDGRRFVIDKITDVRRACAMKVGGTAIRYTIYVNSKRTFLFCDEGKWFVETNG